VDRITEGLLKEFLQEQSLAHESESKDFEQFCNYAVVSKEYSDSFDIQDISVGEGNDTGLDGVAIIVNGRLVESEDEVTDIVNMNGYLDATFIFVQAKSGRNFESSEIGTFFYGAKDFFADDHKLSRNDFLTKKAEISDYIFQHSAKMTRRSPLCKLYYVTTGKWTNDANLVARIEGERADLANKDIFDEVSFHPVDSSQLHKLYRATKDRAVVEINFPNKVTLPDLDEVSQSYLGTLPLEEYFKLIVDDTGNIQKALFYDNIRDFQGDNTVNKEIGETINSDNSKARKFVILNNGITLVAKNITTIGNRMTLRDYQIVNGCQTSHVLYNYKDAINPNIHIPIRIIGTTDENTTNSVIKSTNRQTEVKTEELAAMSEFQKRLESYYETFSDVSRLYYERRSKQYNGVSGVEKVRIITIPTQIRVFASMFLDLPHRAGRYYGTLREMIGGNIFQETHEPIPYYTSAFAYYRGEFLFRSNFIDSKYRKFRYHTLIILRYQIAGEMMPHMNSPKMGPYCEKILAVLTSD